MQYYTTVAVNNLQVSWQFLGTTKWTAVTSMGLMMTMIMTTEATLVITVNWNWGQEMEAP